MPEPYCFDESHKRVLENVKGKDILCLASGGGQQSAIYGLLGANVTVFDISKGQLSADIKAANYYGYNVKTIQGDMNDLSCFSDNSFDIVAQPISICFVSDVSNVYKEVYRILKSNGLYRVAHSNPTTLSVYFVGGGNGWYGIGYRIVEPYKCGSILVNSDGVENMDEGEMLAEYRHSVSDIFNKLIETGMVINGVWEERRHLCHEKNAVPGSNEHKKNIIQQYFCIVARK